MKQVNINKIVVEGFGSISSRVSFDLRKPGINIIRGSNGAGKTTLFEAIFWTLYGETSKGLSNKDIPTLPDYRDKSYKGTYGRVSMSINGNDFTVLRTYKSKHSFEDLVVDPSGLVVFDHQKGLNIANGVSIGENQKILERLMGIESLMFSNSVFFGQKTTRLMDTKEKDKRQIFESILYSVIKDIQDIKDKVSNKRSKQTDQKLKLTSDMSRLEGKKEAISDHITKLGSDIEKAERILQGKLGDIDSKIKGLRELSNDYSGQLELSRGRVTKDKETKKVLEGRLKVLDSKYNITELEEKNIEVETNLRSKKYELSTVSEIIYKDPELTIGGQCDVCGSDITDQTISKIKAENKHREKERNKKIAKIKREINSLEEKLYKFKDLAKLKSVKSDFKDKLNDITIKINNHIHNARRLKDIIANTDKEIKTIQARRVELIQNKAKISEEIEENNRLLEDIKSKISEIVSKVDDISDKIRYLDWWSRIGLGSSGINTYLYESLLVSFNEELNKYSSILGIGVKLVIDKTKKSRPFLLECYDDGVVKSYESLSGGEQQRVNIGIMFALYELVCSKTVKTNILLLDEVFEGLDETGTSMVFQVLQTYRDRSIFVITHNEAISANYVDFIDVTKENGNTAYG